MTYSPQPPNSGGTLVGTRDTIRGNFEIIQNRFNDNHVDFNDGSGKHKFLQLPEINTQTPSTDPSTADNEAAFYSKEANSVAQLFMRRQSDGAILQLTAADVSDTTAQATSGYSCLPGGLLIQYGSIGAESSSSTRTITFPKAFSANPYSIVITGFKAGTVSTQDAYVQTRSTTQFTIRVGDGHSWDFFWTAIGLA